VLLSLLCCYPGGLVLVWGSPKFSQGAKITVSVIFGLFTVSAVITNSIDRAHRQEATAPRSTVEPSAATATATATAAQRPTARPQKPTPPKPTAMVVPLQTLLSEYKSNEVRADSQYKGNVVQITGIVGDVKKDILGSIYVTLGTGAAFEIPVAQCFFDDRLAQQAATLNKGSKITVRGRVDGLMMNVLVRDAEFVP
jgi:hypothetical protein